MIDNYDSFTFNLVHHLGELGATTRVVRNDQINIEDIERMGPSGIVISPGPGTPEHAGISIPLVSRLSGRVPILGVCLGHQAIGSAFGARVVRAPRLMHGKTSLIHHDGRTLFAGLDNPFEATRYHSLILERDGFPNCLEISGWTDQGEIMAVRHTRHHVEGVQFHPESILTSCGKDLLRNFILSLPG
jgi:anthranilate synthase/aminodeoxychorismate synthase-like glutamine amidotransferase